MNNAKPKQQTFRQWLLQYLDSQCRIGDLARDIRDDEESSALSPKGIQARMEGLGACPNALASLETATKMYFNQN
jgi:hypothetical protein